MKRSRELSSSMIMLAWGRKTAITTHPLGDKNRRHRRGTVEIQIANTDTPSLRTGDARQVLSSPPPSQSGRRPANNPTGKQRKHNPISSAIGGMPRASALTSCAGIEVPRLPAITQSSHHPTLMTDRSYHGKLVLWHI